MKTLKFIEDVIKKAECDPVIFQHLERLGYIKLEIEERFQDALEYIEELKNKVK